MIFSQPIYIVAARRSAIGRFGGALKDQSAVELGVAVSRAVLQDAGAPQIDSVTFGHVLQGGAGVNSARQIVLKAGLGQEVPAQTVNRVCGSGLQAVWQAAQEIALGEAQIALAGGTESMSRAPFYAQNGRWGQKYGDGRLEDAILCDGLRDPVLGIEMGETAEKIAEKFGISRADQDQFALQSQIRALAAQREFEREIVPVETKNGLFSHDEHPRGDTSLEKLAKLKPAFREGGSVTAGNSSGLNDGAAALVLASGEAVEKLGLKPRARLVGACVTGCDPGLMGLGPIGALRRMGGEIGWNWAEVEAIEINEAFAAQVLVCQRELGLGNEQLNARGGAIALGHPIGCSGARLLVSLLHRMEDENLQRGAVALCIGGGMGIAAALERV